jgi:hypothetical protein
VRKKEWKNGTQIPPNAGLMIRIDADFILQIRENLFDLCSIKGIEKIRLIRFKVWGFSSGY